MSSMERAPAVRELSAADTGLAFRAMQILRLDLEDEDQFAVQVNQVQRPEGYRLIAAFNSAEPRPAAVAGFRVIHTLSTGRMLYVDDLVTVPSERRRGLAAQLLDWLAREAHRLECRELHLDSFVGPQRFDAHRLYFRQGYAIVSHHFSREANASIRQTANEGGLDGRRGSSESELDG